MHCQNCMALKGVRLPTGLLPYNDFNGSAYIPPAEIQRDMSVFLTTTSDAVAWAKGSFVGIPPLQGTMCQQLTQPALEASNLGQSNYTDTFGYGTTAQNIRPVSIRPTSLLAPHTLTASICVWLHIFAHSVLRNELQQDRAVPAMPTKQQILSNKAGRCWGRRLRVGPSG